MEYKVYFDVFLCDRFTSNFMRNCQLCDDVGIRTTVEITVTETPTKEYIAKIIKIINIHSYKLKGIFEVIFDIKEIYLVEILSNLISKWQ